MTNEKPHISIAFIGPCDSGKSVLISHLLNNLTTLDPDKLTEMREKFVSPYFNYYYNHHRRRINREDLYTVTYSLHQLKTEKYNFTFIDTPGHRDFTKNMITGLALADYAIVVTSSYILQADTTNALNGAKIFYSLLAYLMGAKQNIMCVSKIDDFPLSSSQSEFEKIKFELTKSLKKIDKCLENLLFIPTSIIKNYNIINASADLNWYKGPSLSEAMLNINQPKRNNEGPLRMIVSKICKVCGIGTIICGRVVSGTLRIGQTVTIAPSGTSGIVKSIEVFSKNIEIAYAGDIIGVRVTNINSENKRGSVVSDKKNDPAKVCESFSAEVYIIDHPGKIKAGYMPLVNIHTAHVTCKFEILQRKFDRQTGTVLEERPEYLKSKDSAIVVMLPIKPLCVETFAEYPKLGRFVLSDMGKIVGVGKIREVLKK